MESFTNSTGSIANITSASTVAVSSFSMTLQDPQPIIERIDLDEYDKMRAYWKDEVMHEPTFSEPHPPAFAEHEVKKPTSSDPALSMLPDIITGRVQQFGDNVDTDSIIPTGKWMSDTLEALGRGAFCYTRPEFYDRAQAGATIVVAGECFGSGSSREPAPIALQAAGIQAVIAKSYAFIYGRNQANNGLLGIKLNDEEFYELAHDGEEVSIDVTNHVVHCGGKGFSFRLDPIQQKLLSSGGLIKVYNQFGADLFKKLQMAAMLVAAAPKTIQLPTSETSNRLEW
jgi:homoaconitate hydratase